MLRLAVNSEIGPLRRGVALAVLLGATFLVVAPRAVAQAAPQTYEEEKPYELQEVVVTASGFEQRRVNAPASITVLPAATIRAQRNTNLAELLVGVEGIDVGDTAGKTGGLNISLRGMPSEYTLILIDGRRQNAAGSVTPNGFGETSTSFLPPVSAIERVEIIRGPMATLYGSDAMGGVINIITRRSGGRWSGSVSSDATVQENSGFGNSYSGNATLNGPIIANRLSAMLRGSLLHRRPSELSPTGEFGEATVISRRGPSPVGADAYTVGGRLTLDPAEGHEVWLEFDRSQQVYDNSEGQLGNLDNPDGTPPVFAGYGPEQRFHRDQAVLAHSWRLRSGQLSSSLMRNTTETIGRTLPAGTPGGPPGSGAPNKPAGAPRQLETTNDVFDVKLLQVLSRHALTVGGQYWSAGMIDGVALDPFSFRQWSLFAEDEWRFASSLALTLGIRRDNHSAFGGQFSPRAYLVWNVDPAWTLKGGVSRGYRTPRVEQLVDGIIGFTAQGRTATIGTPSLRPETSTTTEVGLYYTGPSRLEGSVTVFNNTFTDKITRGTPVPNCTFALAPNLPGCLDYGYFPTQENFAQSVNVDEALTRGAEVTGTLPLMEALFLSASYTFTESEQKSGDNAGMPLTNTPRHMVNGSLRGQAGDRMNGWVRGEYRSERARRTTIGADPAYDALGDFRAYTLFHLGGSYDAGRGVTLSATVYNVLNTDFLRYGSYTVAPTQANPSGVVYTSLYNNHQEGRRLWLSTNVNF